MWRAGQVRDSGPVLLGAAFQSNQSPFLGVRGPLLGWGWGPRGDSRHMSLLCGEHRLRRQEKGSRKLSQASCRPDVSTDCTVLAASRCGLQRESSYPRKGTAPRTALGPREALWQLPYLVGPLLQHVMHWSLRMQGHKRGSPFLSACTGGQPPPVQVQTAAQTN